MISGEITVERTIQDVTYEESTIEEVKDRVRHEMVDDGVTDLSGSEFEKRVKEELLDMARDATLYSQGDNRLAHDITHTLTDD
jgi:hypothetical protein